MKLDDFWPEDLNTIVFFQTFISGKNVLILASFSFYVSLDLPRSSKRQKQTLDIFHFPTPCKIPLYS